MLAVATVIGKVPLSAAAARLMGRYSPLAKMPVIGVRVVTVTVVPDTEAPA